MLALEPNAWIRVFERPLYLDHHGRWVWADWEGPATCEVLAGAFEVELDGVRQTLPEGAKAASSSYGLAWPCERGAILRVSHGMPPEEAPASLLASATGVGWVMANPGTETIWVDEAPAEAFPAPFYRDFRASNPVPVSLLPYRCVEIDRFEADAIEGRKKLGLQVQNLSAVELLRSEDAYGTVVDGPVASHLNAMRWRASVPEGTVALRIEKTYDRFHGRQRARVLVDGRARGTWYEPREDRTRRWGRSAFGVNLGPDAAGRSVEVAIDPPAGVPLWSVGRIELYAVVPHVMR